MKKFNILIFTSLLLIVSSCAVKMPMAEEYIKRPSTVGVFVHFDSPQKYREGAQGLLDLALTSGDKYAPMLKDVQEKIKPQEELEDMYSQILESKGKKVEIIYEKFDPKTALKFKDKKESGKKYSDYDFRVLKEEYGVDEILFVDVHWGVQISYYSMIETGRSGYSYFNTRIVNLQDNSLYFYNDNIQLVKIKGKWNTPPNYEVAEKAIDDALKLGIAKEKDLFQK